MSVYEDYRTEVAVGATPAGIADTLPGFETVAMPAARFPETLVTVSTGPTLSTPAATC